MKFVRLFVARDRFVRCVEKFFFFSFSEIKNRDWREIVVTREMMASRRIFEILFHSYFKGIVGNTDLLGH